MGPVGKSPIFSHIPPVKSLGCLPLEKRPFGNASKKGSLTTAPVKPTLVTRRSIQPYPTPGSQQLGLILMGDDIAIGQILFAVGTL